METNVLEIFMTSISPTPFLYTQISGKKCLMYRNVKFLKAKQYHNADLATGNKVFFTDNKVAH
jgi:hypothetical protein